MSYYPYYPEQAELSVDVSPLLPVAMATKVQYLPRLYLPALLKAQRTAQRYDWDGEPDLLPPLPVWKQVEIHWQWTYSRGLCQMPVMALVLSQRDMARCLQEARDVLFDGLAKRFKARQMPTVPRNLFDLFAAVRAEDSIPGSLEWQTVRYCVEMLFIVAVASRTMPLRDTLDAIMAEYDSCSFAGLPGPAHG